MDRAADQSPIKTIAFSADGITSVTEHSHIRYDWGAIAWIRPSRSNTVLSLGGHFGIIVPHKDLPEDVAPELFLERVETWRAAS